MGQITELFPDFNTALSACGEGYDDMTLAEVIAYKTLIPLDPLAPVPEQALNSILAVSLAMADSSKQPLTVLDFGGACGFQFFQVNRVFGRRVNWAIVESKSMAAQANRVGAGHFKAYTKIDNAVEALGAVDLVHASGTIQYNADPVETLKQLLGIRARHFVLARFPIWHGPTVVGIQSSNLSDNGIGSLPPMVSNREVRYPATFVDYDKVQKTISEFNYEIVLRTSSPTADYMVQDIFSPGVSLFCKLH